MPNKLYILKKEKKTKRWLLRCQMDKMWMVQVSSTGPEALRRFAFLDMTVRTLTERLKQGGNSHPECG